MKTLDQGLAFLRDYWAVEDKLYLEALDRLIAGESTRDVRKASKALLSEQTLRGTDDPEGMTRVPGEHGITPFEKPNRFTDPALLAEYRSTHRARQAFAATRHQHAVLGSVVCVWTDSLAPQFRDDLQRRWTVATLDGSRIVQVASVCPACRITGVKGGFGTAEAPGVTPGPACTECEASGALHEWGLHIGPLPEAVEARVIARPESWLCHAWLDSLG